MVRRALSKRSAVALMFTLMAIALTLIMLRLNNNNVPIRFGSLRIRFNDPD